MKQLRVHSEGTSSRNMIAVHDRQERGNVLKETQTMFDDSTADLVIIPESTEQTCWVSKSLSVPKPATVAKKARGPSE